MLRQRAAVRAVASPGQSILSPPITPRTRRLRDFDLWVVNPDESHQSRVRGVIGGDKIDYPGEIKTLTSKLRFNICDFVTRWSLLLQSILWISCAFIILNFKSYSTKSFDVDLLSSPVHWIRTSTTVLTPLLTVELKDMLFWQFVETTSRYLKYGKQAINQSCGKSLFLARAKNSSCCSFGPVRIEIDGQYNHILKLLDKVPSNFLPASRLPYTRASTDMNHISLSIIVAPRLY